MRKPIMLFMNGSDINRAVQAPKKARGLKFQIILSALISFAVHALLVCAFIFAYACSWFSQAVAQFCKEV